jgi:hypothetical protein
MDLPETINNEEEERSKFRSGSRSSKSRRRSKV